jgi:putative transposase
MMIHALEIMPNHVHLFVEAASTLSVTEIVNRFKGYTPRLLWQEFATLHSRLLTLWSQSYCAATVGAVNKANLQRYIANQKGK